MNLDQNTYFMLVLLIIFILFMWYITLYLQKKINNVAEEIKTENMRIINPIEQDTLYNMKTRLYDASPHYLKLSKLISKNLSTQGFMSDLTQSHEGTVDPPHIKREILENPCMQSMLEKTGCVSCGLNYCGLRKDRYNLSLKNNVC